MKLKHIYWITLLAAIACKPVKQNRIIHKPETTLQDGDILFQNLQCGELCDAINAVTHGIDGKDFSHCAMLITINDTLKVIEAIGNKVQVNSIRNFFKRTNDTATINNITVARLKKPYQNIVKKANAFALQQVGIDYDDEFILNNNKWYCSELVYEAYKFANNNNDFFVLNKMTFKDPKTNTTFKAWADYYNTLKKPIPEGELGINPGAISLSDKLQIIVLTKSPVVK